MSLKVPTLHRQNNNNNTSSLSRSRDDDDIETDLEASFRSSMSLYPVTPAPVQHAPRHIPFTSPVPMDISPAPPIAFSGRPRSFGRDLVNTVTNEILARNLLKTTPDKPICKLSTSNSGTASNKARQRAALPTQWMQPSTPVSVEMGNASSLGSPMDVDSPMPAPRLPTPKRSYERGFDPLPNPRKRRSTEPEQAIAPPKPAFTLELDPPSSSPSVPKHQRKFDRFASSGLVLPLTAAAQAGADNAERKSRRPPLTTFSNPPLSAYPILSQPGQEPQEVKFSAALPPPRRAFSAIQPNFLAPFGAGDISLSSDESFGHSSPAADYAKRNNQRVLRRKDGTEDFRPKNNQSPVQAGSSPVPAAMPPFGAEAQGKILPCMSVREDGLMRIDSHVLAKLLTGHYDSEVSSYKIYDCRFDYEFGGGHILGATNVNSTAGIEETLLTPNGFLPDASSSGDGKKNKVILIFHCEFSLHRAPTIAKHLRAKDRAMNNHNYPKVHYPEVYILNGGYSQFFKDYPNFCEPRAYVHMNDPTHETKCEGGLDNFRKGKWGRTRSYTYGDVHARSRPNSLQGASLSKPPSNRNTAPSGGGGVPSLFAAANAARSRRVGGLSVPEESTLAPLPEHEHDHELANTSGSGMESECVEESPCPPTGTHRYSSQMMKMKASHY